MNLTITDDMIIKFVTGGNEYTIDKMVLNENGTDYEIYDGGSTPSHDYSQDYFTIESLEDGNTITFNKGTYATNQLHYYYSTNGGSTWIEAAGTTSTSWNLNNGDKLMFKCLNSGSYGWGGYEKAWYFSSTKEYDVYGNIMSLLYGDNFTNKTTFVNTERFQFAWFFSSSKYLKNAGNLILPATTLTSECYYYMFYGCSSLTTAPELPATTLAYGCYRSMFHGCSSIVGAPVLPATTLADFCYYNMFRSCTSLTTAPELPATTLVNYCYYYMFNGCSSLNYIKCLATNISADSCKSYWVDGVAASGTFVKAASMSSWPTGYSGIPSGWTVQDAA